MTYDRYPSHEDKNVRFIISTESTEEYVTDAFSETDVSKLDT